MGNLKDRMKNEGFGRVDGEDEENAVEIETEFVEETDSVKKSFETWL